ncbi:MAG: DNA polymerase III subunit delta [Pseudomonadota bacterium]|nr:DNA polymerase III subunit delta [Pseudomonadota bacterium]
MKIAPRQANAFLASIPAAVRALLLHGNDLGLISEHARKVAAGFSDDLDDVFSVTRLDGDQLAGDNGALGDAAEAIAMTAPCRLVLVKGRGSEMLAACKIALARRLDSAFIIVEATDTTTRHALVKLFETADNAAALGCYGDDARDIGALLRETMARDGISVTEDAAALVVDRLGSDRAVSRQEIEKLALLAGPGGALDIEDVGHALGDSASLAVTDIAVAAAEGNVESLEKAVGKAWSDQQASVVVLRGCQGYFKQLLAAARAVRRGSQPAQAVKALRPPLHFRLQDRVAAQIRYWQLDAILDAVNRLQDAELAVKTGAADDEAQCAQTLLGICIRGRALRR